MRHQFDFVGPKITPEKEVRAAHRLASAQRKENFFQKGEAEKTPEERVAIELFDKVLKREFLDLDIPEVPELRPERFHVMSEAWCNANMDEASSGSGSYASFGDKAMLFRHRSRSRLDFYNTILHEAIHLVSRQKHWLNVENEAIGSYRLGYRIKNPIRKNDVHVHLSAFNEGVTEATTEELFKENFREIGRRLSLSYDEFERYTYSYPTSREAIKNLCYGVAAFKNIPPKEVWKKIKKGQFTGDMMHLRDVELAYGKGALRVLDALEIGLNEVPSAARAALEEKNNKILQYFDSYDADGVNKQEARSTLSLEVLGLEAYKKYCM
jgi:hypothetical protein